MSSGEIFWGLFLDTGYIDAYLIYRQIVGDESEKKVLTGEESENVIHEFGNV